MPAFNPSTHFALPILIPKLPISGTAIIAQIDRWARFSD
jgi:hypothetical protein